MTFLPLLYRAMRRATLWGDLRAVHDACLACGRLHLCWRLPILRLPGDPKRWAFCRGPVGEKSQTCPHQTPGK